MRLFLGLSGLVLGLMLAACGSEAGGPGPKDLVTTDGGSGGATDPIVEGGDSGATDGSAKDGGAKDGGAKDTRIDPVEVGRSWTYDVTVIGFFPACQNGSFSATALSQSTIEGKTAVHVESFCKGAGAYDYSVDGDRVYSYLANSWRTSLESPVADGTSWTDGFLDYRWESKGSVTTPAGTFSDCWSATTVASYSSYIVFCRGVGPVHWHYDTGFGNGYEAMLTAKNF